MRKSKSTVEGKLQCRGKGTRGEKKKILQWNAEKYQEKKKKKLKTKDNETERKGGRDERSNHYA